MKDVAHEKFRTVLREKGCPVGDEDDAVGGDDPLKIKTAQHAKDRGNRTC